MTSPPRQRRRMDPVEAILRRQRYLPRQLAAARCKLETLRREAVRLGMPELIIADDLAERRMRSQHGAAEGREP